MYSEEEIEKLFELTNKQKKAFSAFKRAFNRCLKEGIVFYNNYETLGAYDKSKIDSYDDKYDEDAIPHEMLTNYYEFDTNIVQWADDQHWFHPVKLKK